MGEPTRTRVGLERILAEADGTRSTEGAPSRRRHRAWNWEGHVQKTVAGHPGASGWRILATADTATREAGVDIHAERDGVELVVEVKGYPRAGAASANTQARHYVGGALLTGLIA